MFNKYALTLSYWIAYVILALGATFAYFTLQTLIESQQKYGTLINLSGKQRMYSQKMAFDAYLVLENGSKLQELKAMIRSMREEHAFITSNLTSKNLKHYYFGENGLEAQVKNYLGLLDAFIASPSKERLDTITAASIPLLSNLNDAASMFEHENSAIVAKLEEQEQFIYGATLLTLLFEAIVIILPMIRLHNNYLGKLEAEVKSQTNEIRVFANIFENSKEGIIIADTHKNIVNVNKAFSDITKYSKADVIGKHMRFFKSDKHDDAFYESMWSAINEKGLWEGEIVNSTKDGEEIYEHLTIMKLVDGDTVNYVSVFSDISERVTHEKELHYMANHDSLTGLCNRTEIMNRIDHAIALADRNKKGLAVAFIDLDNFKTINDTMGHAVGDKLLIEMSGRISAAIRESDTLGRLGGDEFVVLIESLEQNGDEHVLLEKLHKLFEKPIIIDGKTLPVAASLGVVYYPDGDPVKSTAERLVRKADFAMYRAKELGKNRVAYYDDDLEENIRSQLLIKRQLKDAFDHNEPSLYLQPKVELASGLIRGAEALLRWCRDGVFIPPVKFIAIAEENDLIKKIDLWTVQETIRLLEQMHAKGHKDYSIALNVSGRTFADHEAMQTFLDIIDKSGKAANIELEITEGVLIENLPFASDIIDKIRSIGVSVSLDDFGTGYSSFSYLSRMPLSAIKIDRSFISSLHEPKQKILVEAIISFSNKLGMNVIAEGIETVEQLEWLRQQQCDLGQGHLFSKPLPYEAFEKLLDSRPFLNR